jgi:hypothetical protein
MSARRPHLTSTHLTRTHLTIARRAALLVVGSATALGLTAGFAGSASALSPMPTPDLPVIVELSDPEPPVDPPSDPTPQVPVGPAELTTPTTIPDPFPVPPEVPGDLAIDEVDDPELPDPQPEPGDGGGLPEGPGDLTAVPDPTHPDDQPDPTVPETSVPDTTDPAPEVLDGTEEADGAGDAAAETLAFTGNDLGLVAMGAGLLAAGGLAAGVATLARRRRAAEAGELA